jgi:HAD superfamily hydrolase (TIGR01450 family)
MPLAPLFDAYDAVLLDLDGCVWVGARPTRGAADAISAIREAGKPLAFVTNDSHHTPEEYVRKLWSVGVRAALDEVVTVGSAVQFLLADEHPDGAATYVIGSPAVFRHVADAGQHVVNNTPRAQSADVVVLAGHEEMRLRDLQPALASALAGAELVATDRDGSYPSQDGVAPGTGAVVAALEYASGRRVRIVGKPEPELFLTAVDRLGAERALVIGDRIDADLAGASAAGLDAAIVLSGSSTRATAEAAADPTPVAVAADLHALALGS